MKSLFRKLFGKKKNNCGLNYKEQNNSKNKKKRANIKETYDGSLPNYMIISNKEKEMLAYTISLMINGLQENNAKLLEKEQAELIKYLQNIGKLDNIIINEVNDEKVITIDDIKALTKDFTNEEKKSIIDKYQTIIKRNDDFKVHLKEVEKVVKLIENNDISIIAKDEIEREITNISNDKNALVDNDDKIINFNKKMKAIIDNIDNDFISEVLKEYKKVNYVTIATTMIDKDYEKIKKLEEGFKNHRFNKYYYEREINKIKKELSKLKDIKSNKEVSEHIDLLKQELYTKSKDKYDLLYNNEIFMNLENDCDELLNKINAKVIDIKKEKEVQDDKKKEDDEYIKKILLRFKDMELARKLILEANTEEIKFSNKEDLINYINSIYERFNIGITEDFNYEKNKKRTELVILYNDMNKVISTIRKEKSIPVEHINFRMDDLLEASLYKKNELDSILHNNKIIGCDSTIIDEKLDILSGNNKKNKHVLIKDNDKK